MSTTRRLSAKQAAMLSRLAAMSHADTIMELVLPEPRPHGGHSAGYARFHRLRARGLVACEPCCLDGGTIITITAAGRDALAVSKHG